MQMLQIFNKFAWLVHMGILDGAKKIKFKAFVCTFVNKTKLPATKGITI